LTLRSTAASVPVAVLLILAASLAAWSAEGADSIAWEKDPDAASRASKATGRAILVDVGAVWCAPCKEMERTTFHDPKVIEAARDLVTLHVDADARPTFAERYDCDVFPTILFLDARGDVIGKRTGYRSAADMLHDMDHVTQGYDAYMTAVSAEAGPEVAGTVASYVLGAGNAERAVSILKRAVRELKGSSPERLAPVELQLAEAQLALGDAKPAAAAFERLYNESGDDHLKERALAGLVLALRQRGNRKGADDALDLLRERYPGKAAEIEGENTGG